MVVSPPPPDFQTSITHINLKTWIKNLKFITISQPSSKVLLVGFYPRYSHDLCFEYLSVYYSSFIDIQRLKLRLNEIHLTIKGG
jgi:hypothetical protein